MIDLIIVYLSLIVILLLFIIAFLTHYIIDEHRRTTIARSNKENIVIPLLALETNSSNHLNSSALPTTQKKWMKKRPRRQVKLFSFMNIYVYCFIRSHQRYLFVLKIRKVFSYQTMIYHHLWHFKIRN